MLALTLLSGCGTAGDGTAADDAERDAPGPRVSSFTPATLPTAWLAAERRADVPLALRIERLGLDESLVELGIDDAGTLDVPTDPDRVGWFSGGGRPGGPGPTVLVGHVDSFDGPAVFTALPTLEPGDEIEVETARRAVRYVVESVADVPQDPFPTALVFGATPSDTLRLITCTGPYDREAGRYTENRVVTAVPA